MFTTARASLEDALTDPVADTAKHLTRRLVDYFSEITQAAERDPKLDVLSDQQEDGWKVLWFDEHALDSLRGHDGEVLRVPAPRFPMQPSPPLELADWLDQEQWPHTGPEPTLLLSLPPDQTTAPILIEGDQQEVALTAGEEVTPTTTLVRAFERWLLRWREWAAQRTESDRLAPIYGFLEDATKLIEQRDDEFELVLARGLVRWIDPDERTVRRHVVIEQMTPTIEQDSVNAVVSGAGVARRFEDRLIFGHLESYDPERRAETRLAAEEILAQGVESPVAALGNWLNPLLNIEAEAGGSGSHREVADAVLRISDSPALVLRPRNKAALAEAYKRISRDLREDPDEVPVGLAQLIMDTEFSQRQAWVTAQGGASGDFLGKDPRFPLESNVEQERVMSLLRTQTSVVVQGPPGTGKTHTIANLMAALLARGQRVLVTSQKEQALRVLRDKIPPELRELCVLLAGGSRDSGKELQQSLEALSDAMASSDPESLRQEARNLESRRIGLQSESDVLNRKIQVLRAVEYEIHPSVTPWLGEDRYRGSLSDLVRETKVHESLFRPWYPENPGGCSLSPPLTNAEAVELWQLSTSNNARRRSRLGQWIPERQGIPAFKDFSRLLDVQQSAQALAKAKESALSRRLAELPRDVLIRLTQLLAEAENLLGDLRYDPTTGKCAASDWAARALQDLFGGRSIGLWGTVMAVSGKAEQLLIELPSNLEVVEFVEGSPATLGRQRGELDAAMSLLQHLRSGGRIKRRFPSAEQRRAEPFLARVLVNGSRPTDEDSLLASIARLNAEITKEQLVETWRDCGVEISATRLRGALSQLVDNDRTLSYVEQLTDLQRAAADLLRPINLHSDIGTPRDLIDVLANAEAASSRLDLEDAREALRTLRGSVQAVAERDDACPEVRQILDALDAEDVAVYEEAVSALEVAREERRAANRQAELEIRLSESHPVLGRLLASTAADPSWPHRLDALDEAWAWSSARRFVEERRTAEEERRLTDDYLQIEAEIRRVTAKLAAVEAMYECLARLTDSHARALRSYRQHMENVGAGYGKNTRQFRAAARAAMEKAKMAVPAWVVPLSSLLDNIPVERNSFDVVIVDEASQVGMENLFLLWLAPRVIVVGDDKQCTPGENRLGRHERLQTGIERHLRDVEPDIRQHFTAKTNLYGLLSARAGRDGVIRLREHFRCVPEIISWSSSQFYGTDGKAGLIPLRERAADDLDPLKVREVPGFTEGRNERIRNPIEAKQIVAQLIACLADPRYTGKTFGVVVLQGRGQVRLIEQEIAESISVEDRILRKIRVGVPSDFQGDERNVIFLSMVIAPPEHGRQLRQRSALSFQQSYNVAASRAEDQLWLFTSVSEQHLKPEDLRASLLGYMKAPPSIYGRSPSLQDVGVDSRTEPFESLLEQRIFRAIRSRGFHVVPQYAVGSRHLDLVVVGQGGRVAVECDGYRYHTSPEQSASDTRRDRELARMKWEVIRIRESEFELNPDRELGRLWPILARRGILPDSLPEQRRDNWEPVPLTEDDMDEESVEE